MRSRLMLTLAAVGLFIAPALADRKKNANAPETAPQPADVAEPVVQAGHQEFAPRYLSPRPAFPLPPGLATQERTGENPAPVTKVYTVADLVIPPPPFGTPVAEKAQTLEGELIQKVVASVEPQSWGKGKGSIDYFPLGMALVVTNTPAVQEAVAGFLDGLRKTQDQQAVLEVRVVAVSDEWFGKSGLARELTKCGGCCTGERAEAARTLRPEDAARLLRSVEKDPQANVMATPRLTCLTGQPARLRVGQTEEFVTGLSAQAVGGKVVFTPKTESHDLGLDLLLSPTVGEDGKSVKVVASGSLRELGVIPVPMAPVTTLVPAAGEGGKPGPAVPFTQFIQEPTVITRTVGGTAALPDGGTLLLYGGKATIEETVKEPVPMLADVPVLAELFTQPKKVTKTNHLMVLVSARVLAPEVVQTGCDECRAADGRLPKLMAEYAKACRAGQADDARRLAIECLAIDPTCFGRK